MSDTEDLINAVADAHLSADYLNITEETDSDSQPLDSLADYVTSLYSTLLSASVDSDVEAPWTSTRTTDDTLTAADKPVCVTLNSEGLIVGTVKSVQENIPNTPVLSSPSSTDKTWAEVVDLSSLPNVPASSVAARLDAPGPPVPKPQRAGSSRRKPAPAPAVLLASMRKPTQPSRILATKRTNNKSNTKKNPSNMDSPWTPRRRWTHLEAREKGRFRGPQRSRGQTSNHLLAFASFSFPLFPSFLFFRVFRVKPFGVCLFVVASKDIYF